MGECPRPQSLQPSRAVIPYKMKICAEDVRELPLEHSYRGSLLSELLIDQGTLRDYLLRRFASENGLSWRVRAGELLANLCCLGTASLRCELLARGYLRGRDRLHYDRNGDSHSPRRTRKGKENRGERVSPRHVHGGATSETSIYKCLVDPLVYNQSWFLLRGEFRSTSPV